MIRLFFFSFLFTLLVLVLNACSTSTSRDFALRSDDWATWCSINSEDARSGSELAMNNVGTCYLEGLGGFPKNPQIAMSWFQESAKRGNKTAQMNLNKSNIPQPDESFRAQPNLSKLLAALPK